MLSRRHIRLKVMQSLYAFFLKKEDNISKEEDAMIKHMREISDLNLSIIALMIELIKYADDFLENSKNKFFPTEEDLSPNKRFINNKISKKLLTNLALKKEVLKFSNIWIDNDHDVINKLFKDIYISDLYKSYILNEKNDDDIDQRFFINLLNEFILNHQLVNHLLEEKSIYWIDDLPFVATMIMSGIKKKETVVIKNIFKDSSDKDFALQLFRNTIKKQLDYKDLIMRFAKNWDIDRIATMDKILIMMALTEITTMNDMPFKVSLNEYIEISKYYSTPKSRLFVNGILDNAVKSLKLEEKVNKVGKDLK
ncbi:MAG: hypothetical protein CMP73_04500 [Flavobacteriales bacterium]|nr:hypothetical protein [Flavobacteriales bacterium]|tara:strand:+ start:1197 stop:2126 length:930 start_codon:yes stop_codon:yes gene_type:complete